MIEILHRLDRNLKLLYSFQGENRLTLILELETKSAACPYCGHFSSRPHSSYTRSVHDLPIHDQEISLIIHLHKWFCDQESCPTKVFTERLNWLSPYRRKTIRLEETLRTLAFSMSCLQAEKVCHRLHMPASHDALLNLIKSTDIQSEHEDSPFCSY
ncbi:MAG TPA: transposase family protein [Bacillus bacterium]|nr:transposase family protein [Bacillus sp. (in: firmicutes)]